MDDPPPAMRPPAPPIASLTVSSSGITNDGTSAVAADEDKDLLCPICMGTIRDAFVTSCGHSFCYMCVAAHLDRKSDCPSCGHHLTRSHLFPNFLLNKLLKKQSSYQAAKTMPRVQQLRLELQQGCQLSVNEVNDLLSMLSETKQKLEQQEAEMNMRTSLNFLHCLRKRNMEKLTEVQKDLQRISKDMNTVEEHRLKLYRVKEGNLNDNPITSKWWPSSMNKYSGMLLPNARSSLTLRNLNDKKVDWNAQTSHQVYRRKNISSGSGVRISHVQSAPVIARKKRVLAQLKELEECYMKKTRLGGQQLNCQEEGTNVNGTMREHYSTELEDFQTVLTSFTRYSRLRVIAELRHGDLFNIPNCVLSIEFGHDDELFATAGVSRRIKVFNFLTVVNKPSDVQSPVVEMSNRSRFCCLSWNKYSKNILASCDYEGIVTVWDITTQQSVMEYEEHEKRAWSVDFSETEPSMLVSGGDDFKVKLWCTNKETSVINIDMKANVCAVKYNPTSSFHIAVGSADSLIHYFDLRNTSSPLYVFRGHKKAVSYVKFLSTCELASASTDSTLCLWDVNQNCLVQTFQGHKNEKNFVGLTVNNQYVACGSETNDVFVYHKAISKPAAWHSFGSVDPFDAGSHFVSAVCWKSDSPTMLAANSQGIIKVLALAP